MVKDRTLAGVLKSWLHHRSVREQLLLKVKLIIRQSRVWRSLLGNELVKGRSEAYMDKRQ